jgi:hypothetical protein
VLASGSTATEMVDHLRSSTAMLTHNPWTLNSLCMSDLPPKERRRRIYTERTLLCAVSQAISEPSAALDSKSSDIDRLTILDIETSVDGMNSLYLIQKLSLPAATHSSWQDKWSKRPFLYSSAINPGVADLVLDMLITTLLLKKDKKKMRLFDHCCGSGTFLAVAADRCLHATGWDVNPSCVKGTRDNLVFMGFDQEHDFRLQVRDGATLLHDDGDGCYLKKEPVMYDCVSCNLPWDLNTKTIGDEHAQILRTI